MLAYYLLITAKEIPFPVRLYLYCEASVFKVSLQIIQGFFDYSTVRIVILHEDLLIGIDSSIKRNYAFNFSLKLQREKTMNRLEAFWIS